MATHSSVLAWRIPGTGEPGGLPSLGSHKSRTQLSDVTLTFHFPVLEKEMATHSSVLAWRIPGTGEPGGLPSLGSHSRTQLKQLSSSSSSSPRTLKCLLQHHSMKASILQHSAFFMDQLSQPYMTTGKTIALTILAIVVKVMFLLLNAAV